MADNQGFQRVDDTGGFTRVEDKSPGFLERAGAAIGGGAMRGAADLISTFDIPALDTPEIAAQRKAWEKAHPDTPYQPQARWLTEHAPQPAEAKTFGEGAQNVVEGVLGGFVPGAIEWTLGTPAAALHGIRTAQDHAQEQGRTATAGEMVFDSVVEAAGRKLMGSVASRGMGRLPTALTFGGVAGAEDIAEKKGDIKSQALDVGINMVLGFIGPNLTRANQRAAKAAMEAAARGDSKGAMNHLNPVLQEHSDTIAAAARNLGVDASVEPHAPSEERAATPETGGEAKRRAKSTLATQITHRERNDAVARARMAGWEEKFKGMPDDQRLALITAYQRGGIEGVTEAQTAMGLTDDYAPFFKDFAKILSDQASSEHAAGIDYELRQDYAPGYWQDKAKAQAFYSSTPSAGDSIGSKPGFTKGKGFEDYHEGIEAGFMPKSTNPAVIAAMRVEAGNRAIMRRAAMRDMVSDGLAIPLSEETQAGAKLAREKRVQVTGQHIQEMLRTGEAREVGELNRDRKAEGLPPIRGNIRHGGSEYAVNADALARLRDRQSRITATRNRPAEHRDWKTMDIAGSRYLVHPDVQNLINHGLGTDPHQQFTDLLGLGKAHPIAQAERTLNSGWMALRNVTIPAVLSVSAFHALHVLNIDAAQPITAALTQGLNRHMSPEEFTKAVIDGWDSAGRQAAGRRVSESFSVPDEELSPIDRLEQNLMLAGGFSPQMPSVYETRAVETARRAINDSIPSIMQAAEKQGWDWGLRVGLSKEAAKVVGSQVGHIIEKLNGPLFKQFIPELKASAYLNEAKVTLGSRPELLAGTPEANAQLRIEMRKIANSIDNRFGMMQYDKLFWPALARRGLFGTFLSVGWNLGFLREFGQGLTTDIAKTLFSKAHEVSTRTVYASTYLFLATVLSGMMTYMFTGQPPKEAKDYIYPKLPDGTRLNTMFFSREFGAAYYHLSQEGVQKGTEHLIEAKLSPTTQKSMEVLHNQDYFGNQIYDPNGPFWDQVKQGLGHTATGMVEPISLQGAFGRPGEEPAQMGLGFAGFNPAPKYIDRSPTQARILRAFEDTHPQHVIPYAEVQRTQALQKIKQHYQAYLRTSDPTEEQAWQDGLEAYKQAYPDHLGHGAVNRSLKTWAMPEYAYQFRMLDQSTQTALLRKMTPDEQAIYLPYANIHVRTLFVQSNDPFDGFEPEDTSGFKRVEQPTDTSGFQRVQ